MKAIEAIGTIDKEGVLHLSTLLTEIEKSVKVIVLVPENNEEDEEKEWTKAIAKNPTFSFLEDSAEDIYSLTNGKPYQA